MKFVFIGIIIILLLCSIYLWIVSNRNKKKSDYYKHQSVQQQMKANQYMSESIKYKNESEINKQKYGSIVQQIEDEKIAKKEVNSRRRVTASMKDNILKRDNYTCQICGISKAFLDEFCYGLGDYLLLEIDHIESVANGGTGKDEDNLQVLCWRCNRKKGKKKTNFEVKESINYGIKYLKSYLKFNDNDDEFDEDFNNFKDFDDIDGI